MALTRSQSDLHPLIPIAPCSENSTILNTVKSFSRFYPTIPYTLWCNPQISAVSRSFLMVSCIGRSHYSLLGFVSNSREIPIPSSQVGGLEHFALFHLVGTLIPMDFHIFQRGRAQPPSSSGLSWLISVAAVDLGRIDHRLVSSLLRPAENWSVAFRRWSFLAESPGPNLVGWDDGLHVATQPRQWLSSHIRTETA